MRRRSRAPASTRWRQRGERCCCPRPFPFLPAQPAFGVDARVLERSDEVFPALPVLRKKSRDQPHVFQAGTDHGQTVGNRRNSASPLLPQPVSSHRANRRRQINPSQANRGSTLTADPQPIRSDWHHRHAGRSEAQAVISPPLAGIHFSTASPFLEKTGINLENPRNKHANKFTLLHPNDTSTKIETKRIYPQNKKVLIPKT